MDNRHLGPRSVILTSTSIRPLTYSSTLSLQVVERVPVYPGRGTWTRRTLDDECPPHTTFSTEQTVRGSRGMKLLRVGPVHLSGTRLLDSGGRGRLSEPTQGRVGVGVDSGSPRHCVVGRFGMGLTSYYSFS